jgi:hypothetical protein
VEKIGGVYIGVKPDAKGRERVVYELTKAAFATGPLAPPNMRLQLAAPLLREGLCL